MQVATWFKISNVASVFSTLVIKQSITKKPSYLVKSKMEKALFAILS